MDFASDLGQVTFLDLPVISSSHAGWKILGFNIAPMQQIDLFHVLFLVSRNLTCDCIRLVLNI